MIRLPLSLVLLWTKISQTQSNRARWGWSEASESVILGILTLSCKPKRLYLLVQSLSKYCACTGVCMNEFVHEPWWVPLCMCGGQRDSSVIQSNRPPCLGYWDSVFLLFAGGVYHLVHDLPEISIFCFLFYNRSPESTDVCYHDCFWDPNSSSYACVESTLSTEPCS